MRENIEEYRRRMWETYLIEITDDYEYKGFIRNGGSYKAVIPEIRDDRYVVVSKGFTPTYVIHAKYAQDLQSKLNTWLREHEYIKVILRQWRDRIK